MSNNVKENASTKSSQCCVPGCASKNKGSSNVTMYPFPDQETNLISYRCWLREMRACKAEAGEPFVYDEDTMVCELHFRDEDFVVNQVGEKCLKFGTVPFLRHCSTSNSDNDVKVICTKQQHSTPDETNLLPKKRISTILKGRKSAKLNNLQKEIQQQKSLSHQRLMYEKELQEEKLRQLLLKQEEHRKVTKKQKEQKQEEERVEAVTKRDYEKERLNREQQIKELEEYQRQLRKAETQLKKNSSKHIEKTKTTASSANNNNNEEQLQQNQQGWKKKKATLQMKLEQQRERLVEIQQQEMLYEKNNSKNRKKRKHPTTSTAIPGEDDDDYCGDGVGESNGRDYDHHEQIPVVATTTAASGIGGVGNGEPPKSVVVATSSVISCGKCIKLESDLQLISKQYLLLKKDNERLKQQLLKRR